MRCINGCYLRKLRGGGTLRYLYLRKEIFIIRATGWTVIECGKVETETGDAVRLLRLRNPWGQGHGEWRGAWSDNAVEWRSVSEVDRRQLDIQFGPDGEFWMRLDDYVDYFHTTSVCSLAPDFDRDGLDDGLSK